MHHKKLFDDVDQASPDRSEEREGILLGSILRFLTGRLLAGELSGCFDSSPSADSILAEPGTSAPLDNEHRKLLVSALLEAFPSPLSLRNMLSLELDLNLDLISGASDAREVMVSNLVRWAEAQGLIDNLINAARKHQPSNASLASLALTGR